MYQYFLKVVSTRFVDLNGRGVCLIVTLFLPEAQV
jgi:hypothetical protein